MGCDGVWGDDGWFRSVIIDNRYEVVPNSERIGGQAIVYECVDLGNELDEVIKKVAVKVARIFIGLFEALACLNCGQFSIFGHSIPRRSYSLACPMRKVRT